MDDGITPFEHRDVDCSGRSLATLLVAWVGAAMMASVLLRWKYMWIALTILTLLFLFACGYAACNARKAHARVMLNEEARVLDRRRRDRNIQSVSGSVANGAEITEPPAYQSYWITDLPPPYAVVIGAEPPPAFPRSSESEPITPRLSNPPPYSVAIQSETNAAQTSHQLLIRSTNRAGTSSPERQNSIVEESTISRRECNLGSPISWDEDKAVTTEQSDATDRSSPNNSQTVLATGTQYLSNIISCTFGRGPRRNAERNNTVHTTSTTTRDRPDISQLNTIGVSNEPTASRINASTL